MSDNKDTLHNIRRSLKNLPIYGEISHSCNQLLSRIW